MTKDKKAFGNYLKRLIADSGMTQSAFYETVEITKPYFYDILSGKVNPPPPEIQYKMLANLNVDEKEKREFFNLAAEGRGEIPADIVKLIKKHSRDMDTIREKLTLWFDCDNKEKKDG